MNRAELAALRVAAEAARSEVARLNTESSEHAWPIPEQIDRDGQTESLQLMICLAGPDAMLALLNIADAAVAWGDAEAPIERLASELSLSETLVGLCSEDAPPPPHLALVTDGVRRG